MLTPIPSPAVPHASGDPGFTDLPDVFDVLRRVHLVAAQADVVEERLDALVAALAAQAPEPPAGILALAAAAPPAPAAEPPAPSASEEAAPLEPVAAEPPAAVASKVAAPVAIAPLVPAASESTAPVVPAASESTAPVVPAASESTAPLVPAASESTAPLVPAASESPAPLTPPVPVAPLLAQPALAPRPRTSSRRAGGTVLGVDRDPLLSARLLARKMASAGYTRAETVARIKRRYGNAVDAEGLASGFGPAGPTSVMH